MAKTYNRLHIEIGKPINSIGIRPVAGDTNSRYLDVSLYDNGVPIDLTGHQVRINYLKSNDLSFFNQGEITDAAAGRCQFALTNDVISEAKAVEAQISIWGGDSEILSTEKFTIMVSESIRCDDAVEGTNEFGVLVVLFNEIQNALDLMQAISDEFGKPGDKAAEYGVDTFWGILEILAGRTDVESILINYIKSAINSTFGTSDVSPLNEMLLPMLANGVQTFTSNGTFTVPKGINKIYVTACGGGGGGGGCLYDNDSEYLCYDGNGGNGAAAIYRQPFSVTPSQVLTITIGSGGAAGSNSSSSPTSGSAGTATVVGGLVTLAGGTGGGVKRADQRSTAPVAGGGKGGLGASSRRTYSASTSTISSQNAEDGTQGLSNAKGLARSGGGGGSSLGPGGTGASTSGAALAAGYGGGGGGAASVRGSTTTYAASKGGDGYCLIEW
ncbi:MAG: BppU family phage baseplate upper protein [Anaerotignum sp.]